MEQDVEYGGTPLAAAYCQALRDARMYKTAYDLIHGKGTNMTEKELAYARAAVRKALADLAEET